ncbi:MAG: two pore domain potassium channel family protein [Deltaproteobacteria bacterium]|nr:two pore domain potassium channel family protein [Deltaproteobacteria bacterium]
MRRGLTHIWSSDTGLTALLGFLFLQLFVFYPLAGSDVLGRNLIHISFILILVSGVMTVIETPLWGWLALVLGAISFIGRIALIAHPTAALEALNSVLTPVFTAVLIVLILAQVFREGPINYHRIAGAVAAYLLIGVLWGSLYFLADLLWPGAFNFSTSPPPADVHALADRLLYFSFITLTSVGYGDVLPTHPAVRTLAMLEAIVGQLFPAILVARLVAQEIEDRQDRKEGL